MDKKFIFLDGLMIPMSDTMATTMAPGLFVGRGVFETMRVYNGEIFALDKHLKRLEKGLKTLRISSPCSRKKMQGYLYRALLANRLRNARIRLMVWRNKGVARISIAVFPYQPFSKAKYRKGFRIIFSDIRRDERALATRIKSINYLPFLMALRKAEQKGFDEAILLNRRSFLVEGSKANLFLVKGKTLYTPSLKSGCLNGITRQFVLKIARKHKISVRQASLKKEDLLSATEAFLTNSLMEIMPVTFVEGGFLSSGKVGPLTKEISCAYQKLIKETLSKK